MDEQVHDASAVAFAVIREQLKAIPRIETALTQLVQLDRTMAEIVVRSDGQGKQLNAMWSKIDEIGKWHQAHDTAAAERLAKVTEYIDARLATVKAELDVVDARAQEAHAKVDAVVNQSRGAGRAFAIGAALFGGLVTATVIWVVTETYNTGLKVVMLESRTAAKSDR